MAAVKAAQQAAMQKLLEEVGDEESSDEDDGVQPMDTGADPGACVDLPSDEGRAAPKSGGNVETAAVPKARLQLVLQSLLTKRDFTLLMTICAYPLPLRCGVIISTLWETSERSSIGERDSAIHYDVPHRCCATTATLCSYNFHLDAGPYTCLDNDCALCRGSKGALGLVVGPLESVSLLCDKMSNMNH